MKILKTRLGHSQVATRDTIEQNILFIYCEGRGFLWNLFLGWRKTKGETMIFWIPTKALDSINATLYFINTVGG